MQYAADIMTRDVETVHERTKIATAARMMRDRNIGFLAIGNGTIPTGCITDRDLVVHSIASGHDPRQHVVSEVMTRNLVTCTPETKLTAVVDLMHQRKVYRVLVVDERDMPLGVISFGDLVERSEEEDIDVKEALRYIQKH